MLLRGGFMLRLVNAPSRRTLYLALAVSFVAMLLIWLQFLPLEAEMTRQAGYGIVDYELAFSPEGASAILAMWDQPARRAAQRSLLIDYAFMPAYAVTFAVVTLLITRAHTGKLQALGLLLTIGSIAAALFDALENVMLLMVLNSPSPPGAAPFIAGLAASVKFALLFLAILYWGISLFLWNFRRLRLSSTD
jgi:hypothetical protein